MFKKHKFISFLIIFARMGTSTNYIELKEDYRCILSNTINQLQ